MTKEIIRNQKNLFLSEDYPVILEGSLNFPCEQDVLNDRQFNEKS